MKTFFIILILFPFISLGQKKLTFFNQIAYTLNGAGDLGGYKIDAGIVVELIKNSSLLFKIGVSETKGDDVLLKYEQVYQSDAALTTTFAFNRKIKITKGLFFEPEIGFILRSHKWTMLSGTAPLIHGDHIIPPYSSGQWNDKTFGYHVQIPFVFKVNKLISIPLLAEYENDTYGYTFFSVGTGIRWTLKE